MQTGCARGVIGGQNALVEHHSGHPKVGVGGATLGTSLVISAGQRMHQVVVWFYQNHTPPAPNPLASHILIKEL